jgi:hypothetical protein
MRNYPAVIAQSRFENELENDVLNSAGGSKPERRTSPTSRGNRHPVAIHRKKTDEIGLISIP